MNTLMIKSVSITTVDNNGWLRGWLAAYFGPLRQRCRSAVPEVDPKWTRNDTLRPTSEPALLRPTSTHFGDIPRPGDPGSIESFSTDTWRGGGDDSFLRSAIPQEAQRTEMSGTRHLASALNLISPFEPRPVNDLDV